MNLLAASTIDVTVILSLACLLAWLLRRRSAALRHAVLAAAIAVAAAAPVLEALLPQWSVPIAVGGGSSMQASPVGFAVDGTTAAPLAHVAVARAETLDWTTWLFAAWLAGALIALAGLTTGLVRLRRIVARCTPLEAGEWREAADAIAREHTLGRVALLQSADRTILVTCGWLRPKIVLPADSEAWTDARRRIVLAHEVAHIHRRDWATQMLAEALRAVFWFHPIVWIACRRLRQESEYACDDVVMARGVDATDYATHLLDVARHVVARHAVWAAAPAIAHPSTLERRIAVMLNAQRNRDPLSRRSAALVLGAALAVAVPVAAASTVPGDQSAAPVAADDVTLAAPAVTTVVATPTPAQVPAPAGVAANDGPDLRAAAAAARERAAALRAAAAALAQEKPASISGTLYDPLGGLLPGVALTLIDQGVGVTYTATTDRNGSFTFGDLQPAAYELRAVLPGFAPVSTVMPIGPGAALERHITMPIGSLQETITVVCSNAPGPTAPRPQAVLQPRPQPSAPQATGAAPFNGGIGGQIRAPRQIAKANPICPNHVGVDTVIILGARVGIDGYLSDIKVLRENEKLGPDLANSAVEAVRLWQYTPTLLNGVPVEANITVTVFFTWK